MDIKPFEFNFIGAGAIPATNGNPFISVEPVASGATATYAGSVHGGEARLALDATNEAQVIAITQGDVLTWDINQIKRVEIIARIVTALGTGTSVVLGLGTARNSTLDSVATNAWFRMESSGALLVETDDGTTDVDDVASGVTLSSTYKKLIIDFSHGISDVRFYVDDANGAMSRITRSSGAAFSLAAAESSGNFVQFIMELQKTSSTQVGTVGIQKVKLDFWGP